MKLQSGRTALMDYSSCDFMSLVEVKKRSVAWTCIAVLTFASGFGQSLHNLLGIRHACMCSIQESGPTGHACQDRSCPFTAGSASHADSSHKNSDQSPAPDCCSVCRLLAHLGNGVFYLPPEESHRLVVRQELVRDAIAAPATPYSDHSPRGPPAVL